MCQQLEVIVVCGRLVIVVAIAVGHRSVNVVLSIDVVEFDVLVALILCWSELGPQAEATAVQDRSVTIVTWIADVLESDGLVVRPVC